MTKEKLKFNSFYDSLPEFDGHNSIFFINDKKKNLRGFIAFHSGGFNVPSFGATRFLDYLSEEDALKDALRLSKLMSYKNAMAGIPYGGAKAVIIKPKSGTYKRGSLLNEYVKHLNRLEGKFITGTDVGLHLSDLKRMQKKTNYLVGLLNNPEKSTAMGMFHSVKVVVKHIHKNKELEGTSFAIQGVGKVGAEFLKLIYPYACKVYIADIDKESVERVKKKYPKVLVVPPNEIHKQEVDIFCPCALSGVLNSKSVNEIKAKAVVGSANNQLSSEEVGQTLHRLGILYCPDYVVNAGGLIAVVHEYHKRKKGNGTLNSKLEKIGSRLHKIIMKSKRVDIAPSTIADEMAKKVLSKRK